jgi:hypothetical protein
MLSSPEIFEFEGGYDVIQGYGYHLDRRKGQSADRHFDNWVDNVRVIFFGPFENLVCEDEDVIQAASELLDFQTPIACKFLSDKSGASGKLEELGFNVEYVGALISDSIKAGYIPMVF